MAETHRGSVDRAKFFRVTHQKRSGEWVDSRSQRAYEEYRERFSQIQTQVDDTSTGGTDEVDGVRKLVLRREIAGGRTRGRCDGTSNLSLNVRRGISSLTQESRAPSTRISVSQGDKVVALCDAATRTEQVATAREEATRAREEAAKACEEAASAWAQVAKLEDQFHTMMECIAALERNSGRQHPDYDDDLDNHSLDEASSRGRCH